MLNIKKILLVLKGFLNKTKKKIKEHNELSLQARICEIEVHCSKKSPSTCLYYGVRNNNLEVVYYALKHYPQSLNKLNLSFLSDASFEVCEILVKAGYNPFPYQYVLQIFRKNPKNMLAFYNHGFSVDKIFSVIKLPTGSDTGLRNYCFWQDIYFSLMWLRYPNIVPHMYVNHIKDEDEKIKYIREKQRESYAFFEVLLQTDFLESTVLKEALTHSKYRNTNLEFIAYIDSMIEKYHLNKAIIYKKEQSTEQKKKIL